MAEYKHHELFKCYICKKVYNVKDSTATEGTAAFCSLECQMNCPPTVLFPYITMVKEKE